MRTALIVTVALLSVALSAAAQVPFERPVTAVVYGPAPGDQAFPAAASNGKDFMIAWPDYGRGAVYAGRVGADGSLFDEVSQRIAPATPAPGQRPYLFWAGNAYIVFWLEQTPQYSLHSARLDAEGGILEPPHLVLDNAFVGSIDTNGAKFVAAYGTKVAVLDVNGHLLEKDIQLPVVESNVAFANISSNGSGFLATWAGSGGGVGAEIDGVALDPNGHPTAASQLIAAHTGATHAIASNGSDYLLVYRDLVSTTFYTQHIAASAQPLGNAVALPAPIGIPTDVVLRWTGSYYLLSWVAFNQSTGLQDISAFRLDPNGLSLDVSATVLATASQSGLVASHATASNGPNVLVTWTDSGAPAPFQSNVAASVLSTSPLTKTTSLVVSRSASQQTSPRIAFSGRNYLVVWEETGVIYTARMTNDGRTLDLHGAKVTNSTAAQTLPDVVFDGGSYVVGWKTVADNALWLNRINPDTGALQNGDGIQVASCIDRSYDLGTDGTLTMVAFIDCNERLAVQRFNRALLPLDVPLSVTPASMSAGFPSVAWSGTQWMVAFQEVLPTITTPPVPIPSSSNIRAVRITPSMTLLDTQPIAIAATAAGSNQGPRAAASGDDYLIAWTHLENGAPEVRVRHLRATGALGEGTAADAGIFVALGTTSSAIWTGTRYAVGYSATGGDALGATLGKSGDVHPSGYFKIAVTPDVDAEPMLVSVSGRITAAYTRVATEPLYGGVARVFVRDARPIHGHAATH